MPRSSAGRTYRHERRLGGGVVLAVEGPSALIQQILDCGSRVERHVTVRWRKVDVGEWGSALEHEGSSGQDRPVLRVTAGGSRGPYEVKEEPATGVSGCRWVTVEG